MKNIPKIAHFIWTNKASMSLLQTFSILSFHEQNPDWRIILHLIKQTTAELGENIYVAEYGQEDHFHTLLDLPYLEIEEVDLEKEGIAKDKCGILVSDILRLLYLYKVGGVYSDMDMLWLQPMTNWSYIDCIGNPDDFETTLCYFNYTKGHHNNSNIVSEPGGTYLRFLLNEQKKLVPPYTHQAFNTDMLNRLFPTYRKAISQYPRLLNINYSTFYPYSILNLEQLYYEMDLSVLTEQVMGVHWFNGHELSREYVDTNKMFERRCSMSLILKREGYI